jgi:hypothetical protein
MAFTRRKSAAKCSPKELAFFAEYIGSGYNGTKACMTVYKNENINTAAPAANKLLRRDSLIKEIERQEKSLPIMLI